MPGAEQGRQEADRRFGARTQPPAEVAAGDVAGPDEQLSGRELGRAEAQRRFGKLKDGRDRR